MTERITGYSLLFIGIVIMLVSLINVFTVFTGRAKPISVMKSQPTATQPPVQNNSDLSKIFPNLSPDQITQMQGLTQNGGGIPGLSMLSGSGLSDIINLSTHFFLMTFLMGFGSKLANLGVMLVRPIKVKLNHEVVGEVITPTS